MPDPVAIRIGPIEIRWYGIMIMLGVLAATFIAYREARRRREDPDHVWQMFPWALIGGILGARLGWVVASFGSIPQTPLPVLGIELPWPFRILAIWEGGLSMQGVIVGGVIAVILYTRRYGLSFFKWTDIIIPGVALAQAIGRWGNYFNQEAFGAKTDLPWGIPIDVERQRAVAGPDFPADPNARFHPTFAYEMVWNLLNFGLLMWLGRQRRFRLLEGDLLWIYLIFYSIGRYFIEELRVDSAMLGEGLKIPQLVAILTVVIAWAAIIWRHRPGSTARPAYQGATAAEERRAMAARSATGRSEAAAPAPTSRVRRLPASIVDGKVAREAQLETNPSAAPPRPPTTSAGAPSAEAASESSAG